MIQHFPRCYEENQQSEIVFILNSDSPCTVNDRNPSNNLRGWPESCTYKLRKLAKRYDKLNFNVFIRKSYGIHAACSIVDVCRLLRTAPPVLSPPEGALEQPRNLSFFPFTKQLRQASAMLN